MFEYLLKRVALLEHHVQSCDDIDLTKEEHELECIYKKIY